MDRREKIQVDRLLPGVGRQILERRGGWAAGIAEEDIEPAKFLGDVLHQSLRFFWNRHVRGEGRCLGIAAVHGDLRPFFSKQVRDRAADAARSAADERDSTLEAEIHARSMRTAQTFSSAIFA